MGKSSGGTGMVIDRLLDTKMKIVQVKDVESAANLKDYRARDLKASIHAKDMPYNYKPTEEDIKSMSPRQREVYTKSMQELNNLYASLYKAGTAKNQEEITSKIAALQEKILIMQMVTGGLGTIARFLPY